MRYEYESSYEDFRAARRTYIRSSVRRRLRFHFFMWGMLTVGLCLFAVFYRVDSTGWVGAMEGVLSGGLVAGGLMTPLLAPWQIRRAFKRANRDSIAPGAVFLEIAGDTLMSGRDGLSEGRFQRAAVCEVAEDEATMLLFLSRKVFLYYSKTRLPASAFVEIREWLALPGVPT